MAQNFKSTELAVSIPSAEEKQVITLSPACTPTFQCTQTLQCTPTFCGISHQCTPSIQCTITNHCTPTFQCTITNHCGPTFQCTITHHCTPTFCGITHHCTPSVLPTCGASFDPTIIEISQVSDISTLRVLKEKLATTLKEVDAQIASAGKEKKA